MTTMDDPKETLDQLLQQSESRMLQIHRLVDSWLPSQTAGSASSRGSQSALASLVKPSLPSASSSINALYTKNHQEALPKSQGRQGFSNILEQRKRLCGPGPQQVKKVDKRRRALESDLSSDEEDSKDRSSSSLESQRNHSSGKGQKRQQDMLSQYLNRKGAKKFKK